MSYNSPSRRAKCRSLINHEARSCLNKRVYYDALTATYACLSLNRKDPNSYLHIYHCLYCSGIHITSGGIKGHLTGLRKLLDSNLKQMKHMSWWYICPKEIRESMIESEIYALKDLLSYQ